MDEDTPCHEYVTKGRASDGTDLRIPLVYLGQTYGNPARKDNRCARLYPIQPS